MVNLKMAAKTEIENSTKPITYKQSLLIPPI